MTEDKKCYFADKSDPLGQVHVAEKYEKLKLKYQAMMLIALAGDGIPVDILKEMEPLDGGEAWLAARGEASNEFLSAREMQVRLIAATNTA